MSWNKNYMLASVAQKKLGQEANRSEYVLRRLVAHANLLDTLLEDVNQLSVGPRVDVPLAKANSSTVEQLSIRTGAKHTTPATKCDRDVNLVEYDEQDDSSDDEDACCEIFHTLRRQPSRQVTAAPLVRDFANKGERTISGPSLTLEKAEVASSCDTIKQDDLTPGLAAAEVSTNPNSIQSLTVLSPDDGLERTASNEGITSPTEFKSNFEEAMLWLLNDRSNVCTQSE